MRDVFIMGVGMTDFGKFLDRGLKSVAGEAASGALDDSTCSVSDLDAAYVGNAVGGLITGQEMIRGQVMLRPLGLHSIPVFNVENACASSASAFHLGWQAVATGVHDIVLAVGAEKLTHEDKQRSFDAIGTAIDLEARGEMCTDLDAAGSGRSLFMDIYADMAKTFMERSGATQEDFARVVMKARRHGALNERAQFRQEVSIEEVLNAREIVWPLTLPMCSPIGDGAAAVVIASEEGLRRFGEVDGRPRVRVLASVVRSGTAANSDLPPSAWGAAQRAYESAGVGPDDIDLAEIHDATAPAELMIYESLGFAKSEDVAGLVREGVTALGGTQPVNTSGGLLSKGHPIGATGIAQICEITWQLREEAGSRQVDGARVGLTQNGGGWLDGDSAAIAVHILQRT